MGSRRSRKSEGDPQCNCINQGGRGEGATMPIEEAVFRANRWQKQRVANKTQHCSLFLSLSPYYSSSFSLFPLYRPLLQLFKQRTDCAMTTTCKGYEVQLLFKICNQSVDVSKRDRYMHIYSWYIFKSSIWFVSFHSWDQKQKVDHVLSFNWISYQFDQFSFFKRGEKGGVARCWTYIYLRAMLKYIATKFDSPSFYSL